MTFSELAKELRPFYAGEMTVPEFTKELLLQITDYREAVLKYKNKKETKARSEKTFTSYYDGTKMITPIAKRIAVNDHLKPDKFLTFLKRHEFDNIKKEEMCKAFEKYFINKKLNIDNIFDVVADEYVRIVKSNAANPNILQELSTSDINGIKTINEAIKAIETNPVDSFMKELKGVIGNLQDIGHKIASRVSNMKSNTFLEIVERTLPSEQKSKIQKGLVKGTHLCSELESEYNKLQGLYDSIDIYNIDHKEQILDEVLKLISKIEMDDFIEKWRKPIIMSVNNQYIFKLDSLIQKYFKDN